MNPRNTSKTCNECKTVKADLLWSERIYECENKDCNHVNCRDVNAANNIRDRGLDSPDWLEFIELRSRVGKALPTGSADVDYLGLKELDGMKPFKSIEIQGSRNETSTLVDV